MYYPPCMSHRSFKLITYMCVQKREKPLKQSIGIQMQVFHLVLFHEAPNPETTQEKKILSTKKEDKGNCKGYQKNLFIKRVIDKKNKNKNKKEESERMWKLKSNVREELSSNKGERKVTEHRNGWILGYVIASEKA